MRSSPILSVAGARARFGVLSAAALAVLASCGPAAGGGGAAPAKPAAPAAAPVTQPAGPEAAPAAVVPALAPLSPPESVKVGTSVSVTAASLFIGIERGYFRELGLDVEAIPFNSAAEMFNPIAASQIDVATFVADGSHVEPGRSTTIWMVRKDVWDSGAIRELSDLRGKKISPIARGSTVDSQVHRSLALGGVSPDEVELQYVTFPDVPPAFANRVLDAAVLTEPLATLAVEQGFATRWKGMGDIFGAIHGTFVTYSPTMISQRQEVGRRYMVAFLRGVRDYNDAFNDGKDQDEIINVLTKHTNIKDPAVYKKIVVPLVDPNGQMITETVGSLQQWFVDNGFVSTPVNVEEYFDTSYADYAVSVLGRR
jgi:NitT/TauT family transport system substrate-binding protein